MRQVSSRNHATEPFVVFGCRTEGDWFHQVVENHQSHGALAWILQMRTCKQEKRYNTEI